jgi:hypothetical protein
MFTSIYPLHLRPSKVQAGRYRALRRNREKMVACRSVPHRKNALESSKTSLREREADHHTAFAGSQTLLITATLGRFQDRSVVPSEVKTLARAVLHRHGTISKLHTSDFLSLLKLHLSSVFHVASQLYKQVPLLAGYD